MRRQICWSNRIRKAPTTTIPLDRQDAKFTFDLLENVVIDKTNIGTPQSLALETIHIVYPEDDWLHVYTDRSKMDRTIIESLEYTGT